MKTKQEKVCRNLTKYCLSITPIQDLYRTTFRDGIFSRVFTSYDFNFSTHDVFCFIKTPMIMMDSSVKIKVSYTENRAVGVLS